MRPGSVSGKGCLLPGGRSVGGCLVLVILAVALVLGFNVLERPWAYPLFGRPTLTGNWVGTFTTPSGRHFALYLELESNPFTGPGSSELRGDLFDGRAYWCDDHGRHVENSPMSGSLPMFSGYTGIVGPIAIHIEPEKTSPLGLWPANLSGEWRLDTLTLAPNLVIWTGSGMQSSSNDPDQTQPITISLKKAELDVYRSACAQWAHSPLS